MDGRYRFGTYDGPIERINPLDVAGTGWRAALARAARNRRLKEWQAFQLGDQVVILKRGGAVAQVGTPADILANPADDFVRSFVGLDRGLRTLQVEQENGRSIVTDSTGRAVGVLG